VALAQPSLVRIVHPAHSMQPGLWTRHSAGNVPTRLALTVEVSMVTLQMHIALMAKSCLQKLMVAKPIGTTIARCGLILQLL